MVSATVVISTWIILAVAAAACAAGFGACALAARQDPGRGSAPTPRRSPPLPRPGYLILQPPPVAPDYPPWDHATQPDPWAAVPEHLHSDQRAALAALEREVTAMAAEAWRLYRP